MIITIPLDRNQQAAISLKAKQLTIPEFKAFLAKEYSTEEVAFKPSNVLRYRIIVGQLIIIIMDTKKWKISVKETEVDTEKKSEDEQ